MDRESITGDLLVADYTEFVKTHPDADVPSKGVCFLDAPDERIGAFCILNPNHLAFNALNLENHPSLVTSGGQRVRNVECVCNAIRDHGRRWVAFVELKYPGCEDNIPVNMADAFDKFEVCINTVMKENRYLEGLECKVFAIASHPEFELTQPFGSFICNQERLLSLKDNGITLIYHNAVKISTPEFLMPAEVPARYKFCKQCI